MSGSGSNSPGNSTQYTPDPTQLAGFVNNTTQGAQYKGALASLQGQQIYKNANGYSIGSGGQWAGGTTDQTGLLNAFQNWQSDQTNTQNAWQSYATSVQQQGGGQGTQTILGSPTQQTSAIGTAANVNKIVGRP